MCKSIVLFLLLIIPVCTVSLCGTDCTIKEVDANTPTTIYVVRQGDTLGSIASKYSTTWQVLWELNKDTIKDPNLIYVDQKIYISGVPKQVKTIEWVSPEEFEDIVITLMFQKLNLPKDTELDYLIRVLDYTNSILSKVKDKQYMSARKSLSTINSNLIGLEAYELAHQIIAIYEKDKEMGCLLVALAWQETGFHNRRGVAKEVGFYQVLPSTIKDIYGKEIYDVTKRKMEYEPKFSTEFTVWYLGILQKQYKTISSALYHYNGHPDYAGKVLSKYYIIRNMVRR